MRHYKLKHLLRIKLFQIQCYLLMYLTVLMRPLLSCIFKINNPLPNFPISLMFSALPRYMPDGVNTFMEE